MKAVSGILYDIVPEHRRRGRVTVPFQPAPNEGSFLDENGNVVTGTDSTRVARVGQLRTTGDGGAFNAPPAYLAHFREYILEDSRRGSGDRERDKWVINSQARANAISIQWDIDDDADVLEVGFMCVGD